MGHLATDRQLRLTGVQYGRQDGGRLHAGVTGREVDQDQPARVLRLRRTQQTPDGGRRKVRHPLAGRGSHTTTGDHHQLGRLQPLLTQPLLGQTKNLAGRMPSSLRRIATSTLTTRAHQHHPRVDLT
ncbi:hypothetical protein, partial [Streptomyces sp. NPDC020362]|uniref:hypothetical protein n=1 Tax=Streptomyces sp. NPDC020362 TaxID=3154486 RepID=UPI0033C531B5